MLADAMFKKLADQLLSANTALEAEIAEARQHLHGMRSSNMILDRSASLLAELKEVVSRVNATDIDEIADMIIIATTALVNLRKWMALGYATLASSAPTPK